MNLEKICKYIIYSGIFLMPFLLFIVADSMFFPYITGKNFTFRIIVEIIFSAWLLLAIYHPKYRLKKSAIVITGASFLAVMFIANLFGENFYRSFWSNYERMEGYITLLHLGAYFIVLASLMNTRILWKRFFITTLSASMIMAFFYALPEYVKSLGSGSIRLSGTLGNPIYLAVYALFHIFIAWLYILRYATQKYEKWIVGIVSFLNFLILYYTATRGDLLGFLFGLGVIAILVALWAKENVAARKIASGIVLAGILLIAGFIGIRNTDFVQSSPVLSRFANISLEDNTTKARFMVWEMAYNGWKEKPLLGWGQDNFILVFNKHYNPKMYAQEPFFDRAHNVFLDWLIAGGLLGLLAYLSIFIAVLYYIWKKREEETFSFLEKSLLTGLLGAYFFQNLFVFDNIISYTLFIMILAFVYSENNRTVSEDGDRAFVLSSPVYFVAPIIIIFSIFVLYSLNTKAILANRAIIQGLSPHEGGVVENAKYFKRAIAYDTFGSSETREQLVQFARQISQSAFVSIPDKQEVTELARQEILAQVDDDPNNARYALFAGSYLGSIGMFDTGLEYLNKALSLSPNKQQIYFEIIATYLNKGDNEKAMEIAKQTYELEPSFADALKVYAMTAIYNRDYKLAEELLIPRYGTIAIPDDRFVRAFIKVGDYEKVAEIWEKRISNLQAEGKDNAQYHVSLAGAYLELGKREKSISELEKAIKLNPDFKKQGEYYIDEIRAGRNP